MATFEYLYSGALDLELNSGDSNTLYTTARRKQAINDGMRQFADLTECLTRQSSLTISCNTSEYQMLSSAVLGGSTDFVRLSTQSVEYRVRSSAGTWVSLLTGDAFPQRSVSWLNRNDAGWRESSSPQTPTSYYIRPDGGNLYFGLNRPPLVGASQTAEVILPYVARPPLMTSSGDVPFSVNSSVRYDLNIFHEALPHYAAYKLLPLVGDREGSESQLQKFLGYVQRYTQAFRPRGGAHAQLGKNYLTAARSVIGDRRSRLPDSQWS
jgi:hypothetical protein|tara:strand:+ start:48 stop:848 length:801 start_codon:yes stop_codon:yes gene_type:complete